jgi:hypothetical protein
MSFRYFVMNLIYLVLNCFQEQTSLCKILLQKPLEFRASPY